MFYCDVVDPSPGGLSVDLRYVGISLTSEKRCKYLSLGKSGRLCTEGSDGKETCPGDSGGPLVVPRSEFDDTAIVIGFPSWNWNFCGQKGANFFGKVADELPWIKANMGKM